MTDNLYTSDSYASAYLPEKSIYQDDGRIFHRGGYQYDVVTALEDMQWADNTLTAQAVLSSGQRASLRIAPYAGRALRLWLWQGEAAFDVTSVSLVPLTETAPAASYKDKERADGCDLTCDGYTLRLCKAPFGLKVLNPSGVMIFELETEPVAGDFITPPLGFRKRGSESWPFFSWRMTNEERFFGLGEKWNKVEKTSTRATIWSADTCGTNTNDMSYKSLPVIHSTAGWGLMLHSAYRSFWEVGSFSYTAGSALSEDPARLDLFLYFAPDLKGLAERYTALTGRPQMPPRWAFGVWMSRCAYWNREQVDGIIARLRQEQIPFDVVHLDTWLQNHYYQEIGVDACDFDWDEERWPTHAAMLADWRAQGVRTSLWINPYLPEGHPIYDEAQQKGYLARSTRGGLARLEHGQPVGIVDLTNPEALAWWKEHLRGLIRAGASVVKPDYGDRVPEDALFFNGKTGREMHNLYLFLYTQAAFEAVKETSGDGIVWRRAGYLGSQRYPGTWAGDTQVTWQGLRGALRGGLSAGFTSEAFWSHDMGGFVGPKPDPELYIRWAQFGMFSPFARFHGTSPREPWEYGPLALDVVRHYAQMRYSLAPYLFAYGYEATQTGVPLLRHTTLEFPDEPNADTLDDQYLLGPDLLVAPVLQEGARERWVYFPAVEGGWLALEDPAIRYEGGRFHKVPAPLERIPVFVRAGAVIPRYRHQPQHLNGPDPAELLLEVYPGDAQRSLTIPEVERTVVVEVRHGQVTVQPAPVTLRVRDVSSGKEQVVDASSTGLFALFGD